MNMNRKKLYRTMSAAIATTTLCMGLSAQTLAGDGSHQSQNWEGEMRDAWVDGKIEASYTLNGYLNPFAIDTDVKNGIVFLSGSVESQVDKDLAAEIAASIDGVKEVRNELIVKSESADTERTADRNAGDNRDFGDRVNDATTTARVKFELLANDSTEGLQINVDTVNGTVFLNGEVASDQERELAERIAGNAEGVHDVENRLQVASQS
jgi:osmotically-inducible protein OsmY